MMSVNTNLYSVQGNRHLKNSNLSLAKSMSKLSSGLRIARAADDAAGLAISEKMRGQIRSLNQASRNASDAINMIQTAEGAMNEVGNMLHRIRELSVQGANDALGGDERSALLAEIGQLQTEINNISDRTKFNGKTLLNGAVGGTTSISTVQFQVGADTTASNMVTVSFTDVDPTALSIATSITALSTNASAAVTLFQQLQGSIDTALQSLNTQRATLGAAQNRLEYAIANVDNVAENLTAAESRIRDVDVAKESANLQKTNIMVQAGVSVLSQANQIPQMALKLLG